MDDMFSIRDPGKPPRPSTPVVLFGLVGGYIVLQFAWWAWLLISKDGRAYALQSQLLAAGIEPVIRLQTPERTAWMVAGEGAVFVLLLLVALWLIFRTVKHELELARQQRDFLLAASHELRTPIAGLKLHLGTLQRPGLDPAQRGELARHVHTEVERLQGLTEKILLATRLDEPHIPLEPTEVDIAGVLHSVVASARASYARGRELVLDIPEAAVIKADIDAFRSVASNLLENACKYSPANSPVDIKLSDREHGWELEVADRGPGIPESERTLIFRKFHRGGSEETRAGKGTGLGLYIVERLMRGIGGRIEYQARAGGGSIFAASFPQR